MMKVEPAVRHAAITPNDATNIGPARALFVGTGGTLSLKDAAGALVQYTVQSGQILPLEARVVMSTGTTATGIVAWY